MKVFSPRREGHSAINRALHNSYATVWQLHGCILFDVSMTDLLGLRNDYFRHIVPLWGKKNCPPSLISIYFLSPSFDFPKPDITGLSWNYQDWKKKPIINQWKSKPPPPHMLQQLIFLYYFCQKKNVFSGAQGGDALRDAAVEDCVWQKLSVGLSITFVRRETWEI